MRENKVRKIWSEGGTVINGWLGIPNSYSAEVVANTGFDSVTVDQQHGMMSFDAAVPMWQAISTTDAVPLTRVPWNDPIAIMKSLDAGAYGVICPMINNREEAERFVKTAKYPPEGFRSIGPPRGLIYGGPDYVAKANETIVLIAMIETAEAMENLEDICSTPGLDGVYVGPSDLSISLVGEPKPVPTHPTVVDAVERIRDVAVKNGLQPGIHCVSGDMAAEYSAKGFRFCTITSESSLLAAKCREEIAAARA